MTPMDAIAVQNAILPFVMRWQDLDSDLEVVSLDAATDGWDTLLAGQGINLRTGFDQIPKGCAVATGFDTLDTLTPNALGLWASEAVHTFRNGGLLVLGGDNPEHPEAPKGSPSQTDVVRVLKNSGFARVCVISPSLGTEAMSLFSALYGMSRRYAIVAQTDAYGKSFDIFSTAFAEASTLSTQTRFKHAETLLHNHIHDRINGAETALHDRINGTETALHNRISAVETALHDRILRAEALLRDQAQEISNLQDVVSKLKYATRRRGLRKLAYNLKQKWRARHEAEAQSPTSVHDALSAQSSTSAQNSEEAMTFSPSPPARRSASHPTDPMPLSAREVTTRDRLLSHLKSE